VVEDPEVEVLKSPPFELGNNGDSANPLLAFSEGE
jgi:hypothetical protein